MNYTNTCQSLSAWDDVTVWCRGLVLDVVSWQVAAQPFRKFFNLGEQAETELASLPNEPFAVYEKLDGSLGISYLESNGPALATRGSFTSRQAVAGTEQLRMLTAGQSWPEHLTFLFEIILSESRGVARYDFEGLVLLSVIDRRSQRELSWSEVQDWANRLGCRTPQVYPLQTLSEVLEHRAQLPASLEGYVLRFASGFRVKVKGDAYLAVYKLMSGITEERLLRALAAGTADELRRQIPEEFYAAIDSTIHDLGQQAEQFKLRTLEWFRQAPPACDRKTFAQWTQQVVPADVRPFLFQLFDRKSPNWFNGLLQTTTSPASGHVAD